MDLAKRLARFEEQETDWGPHPRRRKFVFAVVTLVVMIGGLAAFGGADASDGSDTSSGLSTHPTVACQALSKAAWGQVREGDSDRVEAIRAQMDDYGC